jgi:hypothetical protein
MSNRYRCVLASWDEMELAAPLIGAYDPAYCVLKSNEVSYGEVLGDKSAMYIVL